MPETMDQPRVWKSADAELPIPQLETVSDRLQRLEERVASIENGGTLESRLAERVIARLKEQMPPAPAPARYPMPDGIGAALIPASMASFYPAPPAAQGFWSWLGFLRELRLMSRMYFDPRYRLSRITQFGVPIILALLVLNYFFVGGMPLIGFLVERFAIVILAIGLYKILSYEAQRYDAVLAYLHQQGR